MRDAAYWTSKQATHKQANAQTNKQTNDPTNKITSVMSGDERENEDEGPTSCPRRGPGADQASRFAPVAGGVFVDKDACPLALLSSVWSRVPHTGADYQAAMRHNLNRRSESLLDCGLMPSRWWLRSKHTFRERNENRILNSQRTAKQRKITTKRNKRTS